MPDPSPRLSNDAPITSRDGDLFERGRIAEQIALEASAAPAEAGFVIAICGPWGSGKTSVANMVVEIIDGEDDHLAVTFNPWMFSGAEDLLGRFFGELAGTLRAHEGRFQTVARRIGKYAGALSGVVTLVPGVGVVAGTVLSGAEKAIGARDEPTLDERRRDLIKALGALDGRIVVFLDDLDRLTDDEIREVVRLVKLVGDLPRITYVLSFDRVRVEQALGAPEPNRAEAAKRGRAYLEKIVQSRHDVPPLRTEAVMNFMGNALQAVVDRYGELDFHEADWENMVGLALRFMVATPRDAKRVANSLPATLDRCIDEVAVVDLIGLEALRVFEPDVHAALGDIPDILVGEPYTFFEPDGRERHSARIDEILTKARTPAAVKALLGQLFPHAQAVLPTRATHSTERLDKRVSQPAVFRSYLYATLDEDALPASEIERLAGTLPEPEKLREALDGTPERFLDDVVDRLAVHSSSFLPEHALGAAKVLIALERRLPEDRSPFQTLREPTSWKLRRLIWLVLRSEQDETKRGDLAVELVRGAPDLSSKWCLLGWFGTRPEDEKPDPDAQIISEEATACLGHELFQAARRTEPGDLAAEHHLVPLLIGVRDEWGDEAIGSMVEDDELMIALLTQHYGERTSQTLGEAAWRRVPKLYWRSLIDLVGEEKLKARILELESSADPNQLDEDSAAALALAVKIARGEVTPDPDPE